MSVALRVLLPAAALLALGILLFGRQCESESPALRDAPEPGAEHVPPDLLKARGSESTPALGEPELSPVTRMPDARRGPVRVKVLARNGLPLPGALVLPASVALPGMTNERGEVVLGLISDLPYDGSVVVQFGSPQPWRKEGSYIPTPLTSRHTGESHIAVRGPEIEFQASTGLHVDVGIVSAETGGAIEGARLRCRKSLTEEGRTWGPASRRFLMVPGIGRETVMHWDVEPARGWTAWERTWVRTTISPYAEALDFVYPLRREMTVTITPVDSEGTPVAARVHRLRVAGRTPGTWSAEGDAYGRLRVRGVPFLPGDMLDIGICRRDFTGPARERVLIPDHPGTPIDLLVRLPDAGELPKGENESIGIGGGAGGGAFKGRGVRRRSPNALVVTVLRRNGKPAVGASVTLPGLTGVTDTAGRVRFTSLAAGRHTVRARQVGVLPIVKTIAVPERGEARLTLREGAGSTVELTVVDDLDRPLSFATLAVKTESGLAWVDMDGVRQRIDPHTDHLGRRVLRHVEPGFIEMVVSWGSRRKTLRFRVKEGETVPVRAVLRRPTR